MVINQFRNTTLSQHARAYKNESSVTAFGRFKSLLTQTVALPIADVSKPRYALGATGPDLGVRMKTK